MIKMENSWQLRFRQEECLYKLITAYKKGNKAFLIAAVCRFGKTITTLQSLKNLAQEMKNDSQVILILCTMNVQDEWAGACEKVGFDPTYCKTAINDIDFDRLNEFGKHVVYVSTQKLGNQSAQSLALIKWFNRHQGLKTLVYDECHLGSGTDRTRGEILDRLDFDYKVYLSGTPYRKYLKEEFKFDKAIGQDTCYIYSMTDEREDYNNGLITDYTPVKLKMMVLDYQEEIEKAVSGEEDDNFTKVYGVSSKYFRKLFSERDMRDQAIEFLQKIVEFAKEKHITNILFYVPIRKVGEDIVKNFEKIFKNSIEFRSLCGNYPNKISKEEEEALSQSEAAALNVFYDSDNPTNKVRIGITCNKCGTGTTLTNLEAVAFLKDVSNVTLFSQLSQRARTPKEGKEEAYVLVFDQWSGFKVFESFATLCYPGYSTTDAIKKLCENGAMSMTLNLNQEVDYEYIIDILSYYHPGEELFDDFDIEMNLDEFTFIVDIEKVKQDLAKKYKELRNDPDFNNAHTLNGLKKALKNNEEALEEVERLQKFSKEYLHSALTEIYVAQVVEMFADYEMTLDQAKDYDNYPEMVKVSIEAGLCTMNMWKYLNDQYVTYFAKIYNYLKKENIID